MYDFMEMYFQTHTQAERKIVEAKRESLLREASENDLLRSSLPQKLAELDSLKPHPYGTIHAVSSFFPFYSFCYSKALLFLYQVVHMLDSL